MSTLHRPAVPLLYFLGATETMHWLRSAPRPPDTTFIVHGEKAVAAALHDVIEQELGWTDVVPRYVVRSECYWQRRRWHFSLAWCVVLLGVAISAISVLGVKSLCLRARIHTGGGAC